MNNEVEALVMEAMVLSIRTSDIEGATQWLTEHGIARKQYIVVNFMDKILFKREQDYCFFKMGYTEDI